MAIREVKAKCHGCGNIGHFKKNCPMNIVQVGPMRPPTEEPIILTELINEWGIKSFLDKCFQKNVDTINSKMNMDTFIIRFNTPSLAGGQTLRIESRNATSNGIYYAGNQNQLTFRFKPTYGNVDTINNCTNNPFRYGGYTISKHSSSTTLAGSPHDEKVIKRRVLTALNACQTVDDLILCFKSYPIFTELECNFYELKWEDIENELSRFGEILFSLRKETKRDNEYSKYYHRIGNTNIEYRGFPGCWGCLLSTDQRNQMMSMYATHTSMTLEEVKVKLTNIKTVKIEYVIKL